MRILYIDIDSQRPDHLGCYGYHRNTSPNIDAIAEHAVRFDNLYISDAPCLPSRTALFSGRFGYKTGVVNHGGVASQPFIEGINRSHQDNFYRHGWMNALRKLGYSTTTISSFGERHAAWHWYAGFNEIINPGRRGLEDAQTIGNHAMDWLSRNGVRDNWFLHVNFWDPHTPYRTPLDFGNPFENEPIAEWLTEDVRQKCWDGYGPHSAQDVHGFGTEDYWKDYPRLLPALDSMDAVKQWIDGYDIGIRYMDDYVGRIINNLSDLNVLDETIIIISADHGENQGELNVWGDHQTADSITCRVPLIIKFPELTETPRVDSALHYHFDWAATLIELLGGEVPEIWDGKSFAEAFKSGEESGRDHLIMSQGTWACQRAVRYQDYLYLYTYHDGFKDLPEQMLFNVQDDPHLQNNLAPDAINTEQTNFLTVKVQRCLTLLKVWESQMKEESPTGIDPMDTVIEEGGPVYIRGELENYVQRLRDTRRAHHAEALLERHGDEI